MKKIISGAALAALLLMGTANAGSLGVNAANQDVSGGTVTAAKIMADSNGWMVVHRTDENKKPGAVVGHAPLKKGENLNVTAILNEPVKKGEMLMLMLHSEKGGSQTGIFEYTLGAKEDGAVKVNKKLVVKVITAK